MIKNIFITGRPGCGKTSLIMEILKESKLNVGGFYTQEIREGGQRLGFKIVTLDDKKGILAHIDVESPYRVSKYRVNLKDLEEIGVKSILDALKKNEVVIVDEVGKMELFSEKFKKAVEIALNSKNKVLGTIMLAPHRTCSGAGLKPIPFCDKIKKRPDTEIFYLTRENRQDIKKQIKELLK